MAEGTPEVRRNRIQYWRIELMNILGGAVCVKCGFKDIRALQFDHIEDDGYKEGKKGPATLYKYYADRQEYAKIKLQVLCANCNIIKEIMRRKKNWQ